MSSLIACAIDVELQLKNLERSYYDSKIDLKLTRYNYIATLLLNCYSPFFDSELKLIQEVYIKGFNLNQLILFINNIRIKSMDSDIYFMFLFLEKMAKGDPEVLNLFEENPPVVLRLEDSPITAQVEDSLIKETI